MCGLGNPGAEYAATRHNVGWWLLDELRAEWGTTPFRGAGIVEVSEGVVADHDVVLMKPLTYMNRSGDALAPLLQFEGFDVTQDLLVLVDDVALPVGRLRLRPGGSSGGHNGLKSLSERLGSPDYLRLRLGIGRPPSDFRGSPADFVLGAFTPQEATLVFDLVVLAANAVELLVREGLSRAMNEINRRPS